MVKTRGLCETYKTGYNSKAEAKRCQDKPVSELFSLPFFIQTNVNRYKDMSLGEFKKQLDSEWPSDSNGGHPSEIYREHLRERIEEEKKKIEGFLAFKKKILAPCDQGHPVIYFGVLIEYEEDEVDLLGRRRVGGSSRDWVEREITKTGSTISLGNKQGKLFLGRDLERLLKENKTLKVHFNEEYGGSEDRTDSTQEEEFEKLKGNFV